MTLGKSEVLSRREVLRLFGAAGSAALLAGCVQEKTTTPTTASGQTSATPTGKVTVLLPELGNERLDFAYRVSGAGTMTYLQLLHGSLLVADQKFLPLPGIAKEWSLSPDGLTWTFTIRKGLKWHDGSEITAKDVLWTLKHTLGPQAPDYLTVGKLVQLSKQFESLELIEPDTVRYKTKQAADALLPYLLAISGDGNYFGVLPQRDELGDGPQSAAFDKKPIGAGPMRLVSHQKGSMEFERFDDYYYQPKYGLPEDRRVSFKSLVLTAVPEEATRVAAIAAGDADIALASLASRKDVEGGGGRLVFGPEGVAVEIRFVGAWGTPVYPTADQRVRQALDYSIDKKLLQNKLWGGPDAFELRGWVGITPSSLGYSPALDPTPFDPDKARQLLAAAGYAGGKGFGTLIVNTRTGSPMPFLVESALAVADMWRKELGIAVEVRVTEQGVLSDLENNDKIRGQLIWRDTEPTPDRTDSVLLNDYGNRQRGVTRLHDDLALFAMVQTALSGRDRVKLAENARELFPRLKELAYQIGIGYGNIAWAVGRRVETWQPRPMTRGVPSLHTLVLRK